MSDERDKLSEIDELESDENDVEAHQLGGDRDQLGGDRDQLGGDRDSLVHANRCDTGGFLAQDISDLHGNLLGWITRNLVYIMPIVNTEKIASSEHK